jgi:hypothetical protein
MWSESDEKQLEVLPERLDDVKADIYNSHILLQDTSRKRDVFNQLTNHLSELLKRKNKYITLSAEGIADFHKTCFLMCAGCGLDYHAVNLHYVYNEYLINTMDYEYIRNLSKLAVWQQYWSSIKLGNHIFQPILTQEQHTLLNWSKFYDSVYESAECPPKAVIEDNLLLDGWCIVQRRERNKEEGKKAAENFGSGGEIFVKVEDADHASRINALNDAQSKAIKRQQENMIQQRGTVKAQDMPNVKMELRQKATQAFRDKVKGR